MKTPLNNKEKRSIKVTVKFTPTEFLAFEMYASELNTKLDWNTPSISKTFRTLFYNSRKIKKYLKLIKERSSE